MNVIATKIAKLLGIAFMFALLPLDHAQALAARPSNGKIAFTSDRDGNSEIYLMNADGSEQTRLTNNLVRDDYPTWSPDGKRIAFVRQSGGVFSIRLMKADGTNETQLTTFTIANDQSYPYERFGMDWSPDGTKIAFQDAKDIFSINIDGSNRINLTNGQFFNYEPTWSPDGSRLAFARSTFSHGYYPNVHVMNADGSTAVRITTAHSYEEYRSPAWSPDGERIALSYEGQDDAYNVLVNPDGINWQLIPYGSKPKWSPDGVKIVFYESFYPGPVSQISVVNRDGSGGTQLTSTSPSNFNPDWQPLFQTATLSGRVLTPDGRALRNAAVTLTDAQDIVRTVTTSSFGYYAFDNIEIGSSYTISVSSRRYRFTARSLLIESSLTNMDFVGLE